MHLNPSANGVTGQLPVISLCACPKTRKPGRPSQSLPHSPQLLQPGISSDSSGKSGDSDDRRAGGLARFSTPPPRPYRLQNSQFSRFGTTSSPAGLLQEVPAGTHPGPTGPPDVEFGIPAFLADVNLGNVGFADFGTGQVDPGVAFFAFDHGPPGERFHAEAGDQIPRVVICQRPEKRGVQWKRISRSIKKSRKL